MDAFLFSVAAVIALLWIILGYIGIQGALISAQPWIVALLVMSFIKTTKGRDQ